MNFKERIIRIIYAIFTTLLEGLYIFFLFYFVSMIFIMQFYFPSLFFPSFSFILYDVIFVLYIVLPYLFHMRGDPIVVLLLMGRRYNLGFGFVLILFGYYLIGSNLAAYSCMNKGKIDMEFTECVESYRLKSDERGRLKEPARS